MTLSCAVEGVLDRKAISTVKKLVAESKDDVMSVCKSVLLRVMKNNLKRFPVRLIHYVVDFDGLARPLDDLQVLHISRSISMDGFKPNEAIFVAAPITRYGLRRVALNGFRRLMAAKASSRSIIYIYKVPSDGLQDVSEALKALWSTSPGLEVPEPSHLAFTVLQLLLIAARTAEQRPTDSSIISMCKELRNFCVSTGIYIEKEVQRTSGAEFYRKRMSPNETVQMRSDSSSEYAQTLRSRHFILQQIRTSEDSAANRSTNRWIRGAMMLSHYQVNPKYLPENFTPARHTMLDLLAHWQDQGFMKKPFLISYLENVVRLKEQELRKVIDDHRKSILEERHLSCPFLDHPTTEAICSARRIEGGTSRSGSRRKRKRAQSRKTAAQGRRLKGEGGDSVNVAEDLESEEDEEDEDHDTSDVAPVEVLDITTRKDRQEGGHEPGEAENEAAGEGVSPGVGTSDVGEEVKLGTDTSLPNPLEDDNGAVTEVGAGTGSSQPQATKHGDALLRNGGAPGTDTSRPEAGLGDNSTVSKHDVSGTDTSPTRTGTTKDTGGGNILDKDGFKGTPPETEKSPPQLLSSDRGRKRVSADGDSEIVVNAPQPNEEKSTLRKVVEDLGGQIGTSNKLMETLEQERMEGNKEVSAKQDKIDSLEKELQELKKMFISYKGGREDNLAFKKVAAPVIPVIPESDTQMELGTQQTQNTQEIINSLNLAPLPPLNTPPSSQAVPIAPRRSTDYDPPLEAEKEVVRAKKMFDSMSKDELKQWPQYISSLLSN